jgi:hypothetical protein
MNYKAIILVVVLILMSNIVVAVSSSRPTITVEFDEPVRVSSIIKALVNETGYYFDLIEIFRIVKIFLCRFVINGNRAATGPEKDPGD